MSTKKTTAELRGQIVADIDAVRMGLMPKDTAAVIFAGYRELNKNMLVEVEKFKAALQAKKQGQAFSKAVGFGRLEIDGEEQDS